jgi:hypothetical protein
MWTPIVSSALSVAVSVQGHDGSVLPTVGDRRVG